jgi:hypothetical protein
MGMNKGLLARRNFTVVQARDARTQISSSSGTASHVGGARFTILKNFSADGAPNACDKPSAIKSARIARK